MKLISWNVNGLRANITKGFETFFKQIDADIFCIQETKMQEEQIDITIQNILKKLLQNTKMVHRVFTLDGRQTDLI